VSAPVLGQIDLVCADVSKTIAFYRALGLKFPNSAIWTTKTGPHHVRIEMGSMEMALDRVRMCLV
jgi:hypothetical protein